MHRARTLASPLPTHLGYFKEPLGARRDYPGQGITEPILPPTTGWASHVGRFPQDSCGDWHGILVLAAGDVVAAGDAQALTPVRFFRPEDIRGIAGARP